MKLAGVVLAMVSVWASQATVAWATPRSGGVKLPDEAAASIMGGDFGEMVGTSVSATGDVDGDGKPDVLVGAAAVRPAGTDPALGTGAGYLIRGGRGGVIPATGGALPQALGFPIYGGVNGVRLLGGTPTGLGDVNGDGRPDLGVIGTSATAPTASPSPTAPQSPTGATTPNAWVIYGRQGLRGSVTPTLNWPVANGYRIVADVRLLRSAGDMNGDRIGDIAVATPTSVYVLYGKPDRGTATLGPEEFNGFRIEGATATAVAAAGDMNGDGLGDLLIGATSATPQGRSYVVYGSAASPGVVTLSDDMPHLRGHAIIVPNCSCDGATGHIVANVGDVNHDGLSDAAVVGPPGPTALEFIVLGHTSPGAVTIGDGLTRQIHHPQLLLGVARVGDVNGDELDDVAVAYGNQGKANGVLVLRAPGFKAVSTNSSGEINPASGFAVTGNVFGLGDVTMASVGTGVLAIGSPAASGGASGVVHLVRTSQQGVPPSKTAVLTLSAALSRKSVTPTRNASAAVRLRVSTDVRAAVRTSIYQVLSGKNCYAVALAGAPTESCVPKLRLVGRGPGAASATGQRTVGFSGRVRGDALPAGRYLLTAQAGAGARRSPLVTIAFRVRSR